MPISPESSGVDEDSALKSNNIQTQMDSSIEPQFEFQHPRSGWQSHVNRSWDSDALFWTQRALGTPMVHT